MANSSSRSVEGAATTASGVAVPTPSTQYRLAVATLLGRTPTRLGEHITNTIDEMQRTRIPSSSVASKEDDGDSPIVEENLKVLYINLIVSDPSEAVERTVKEKIAEKDLPKPLHKVASKVGQRVAKRVATPERVATVMAEKLPEEIPKKLEKRGVVGVAETVFVEAPYMVIQLQVQRVDTNRLVQSKTEDFYDDDTGELESRAVMSASAASYITKCLDCFYRLIGARRQAVIEDFYLPRIVQTKMESFIPEFLAEKLERKGFEIDSEVLPEEKQSRFFYTQIQEMRAAKKDSPTCPIVGFFRNKEKKKTK